MDILNFIWTNGLAFLFILTVIVFTHELGHYLVARHNGVRIEVFSIGFGPEIFGWNDKSGTRWKLSLLPLGGYVKMFGERAAPSKADEPPLTPEDMAVSFHHKSFGATRGHCRGWPGRQFHPGDCYPDGHVPDDR